MASPHFSDVRLTHEGGTTLNALRTRLAELLRADPKLSDEEAARAVLSPLSKRDLIELVLPVVVDEAALARNTIPKQNGQNGAKTAGGQNGAARTKAKAATATTSQGAAIGTEKGTTRTAPRTMPEFAAETLADMYTLNGQLVAFGDLTLDQHESILNGLRVKKKEVDAAVEKHATAVNVLKAYPRGTTLNDIASGTASAA